MLSDDKEFQENAGTNQPPTPPVTTPTVTSNESSYRLLPATLFLLICMCLMTILLVYMNNKEMRQQQFRQNMRQEDELASVSQDDDTLVAYIREWQLISADQPFPPHARHPPPPPRLSPVNPTQTENYVAQLLNYKRGGVFVEVGAYGAGAGGESRTEWLEDALNWHGLLVTPDARDYFRLRARRRAPGTLTTHACLSTSTHPKEITYQESAIREEVGVIGVASLGSAGEEFSARVKCFPLYSLLLAAQEKHVDFLSLSCGGCELSAFASLPWNDKIHIAVVEIVGKQTDGIDRLMAFRGYNIAKRTPISTIYAMHDILTLKI